MRYRRLQSAQTVIQRQHGVATEGHNDGLVLNAQHQKIFKLTVDGQRLGKCDPKREERFRSV